MARTKFAGLTRETLERMLKECDTTLEHTEMHRLLVYRRMEARKAKIIARLAEMDASARHRCAKKMMEKIEGK